MGKPLVIVNGRKTDKISVFDHGFLYSDGVFETFRIFNGKPFFLKNHIDRLYKSAAGIKLKIHHSKSGLVKILNHLYKDYGKKDAFVRIIITRGVGEFGLLACSKQTLIIIFSQRKFYPLRKIRAVVSPLRKYSKDNAGRAIKGLDYSLAAESLYRAESQKVHEIIFLNESGAVTEATTSNLFLVKNGRLFTPSLDSGPLAGITRKIILKHFKVTEKRLFLKDLLSADEVFLTGTVDFVISISSIQNKIYKNFEFAKRVFEYLYSLI